MPPDQLMMRLRGRVNQYKSWNDSIKALKMAVLNVSIDEAVLRGGPCSTEVNGFYPRFTERIERQYVSCSSQLLVSVPAFV